MIHSNELRIGNTLKDSNGCFLTVCVIGETDDVFVLKRIGLMELNVQLFPIPITIDLLMDYGFKKEQDNYVLNTKPSFMWGEGNDDDWFISFQMQYGCDWSSAYNVRYLHQLENLYFTLTGEEFKQK